MVLHGAGGNAEYAQRMAGFTRKADSDGFIVAYPNGTGKLRRRQLTWNAGDCCGDAWEYGVDDVAFFPALTARLKAELKVDPLRVYAAGFDNGGMMAQRLACDLSDKVAAAASVAGALPPACRPAQPVSVMLIHGTADQWVPYARTPHPAACPGA